MHGAWLWGRVGLGVALLAACRPGAVGPQGLRPGASARPLAGGATASASPGVGPGASAGPTVGGGSPLLALGAGLLSNNGGGLITDNGAGLLANAGASLVAQGGGAVPMSVTGLVSAPAQLIGNNGGGLIGNNGGGLIGNNGGGLVGNNGGGFRLLAEGPSVPYAGATVYLLDASGKALTDAAGKPVVAQADAQGRYRFGGALPAGGNFLVAVPLPAGRGQLGAIAPKGTERVADVGLVSTLSTAYILREYVRPQADAQVVLDRLPPEEEAKTRARTEAALQADGAASTAALTRADGDDLVALVAALRGRDPALDGQLARVREILLAGQSNLGVGQKATEASLPWIRGLLLAKGGGFYLNAALSGRVFHVGADGILATAAGASGGDATQSLADRPATGVALGLIRGLLEDGQGRLLILESNRLSRREANGRLTQLWPASAKTLHAVGLAPDGDLWVLAADGCHRLREGQAPQLVQALSAADAARVRRTVAFGQDAQGHLVLQANVSSEESLGSVRRYDPNTGAMADPVATFDGLIGLGVDAAGRTYLQASDRSIRLREPSGDRPLIPAEAKVELPYAHLALQPDGQVLWAHWGRVQRVSGTTLQSVAGKAGVSVGPDGQIGLTRPAGLAQAADGALLVAVAGENQVVRVANGAVAPVAGNGQGSVLLVEGDGGPALSAPIPNPTALRLDARGRLHLLQAGRVVRRVDADGRIQALHQVNERERIYDFWVSPDAKQLYLSGAEPPTQGQPLRGFVRAVDLASGVAEDLIATANAQGTLHLLALDAQARLHVLSGGQLRRWDATARQFQVLQAHPDLVVAGSWRALGRAAFDPRGRLAFFQGASANRLMLADPSTGTLRQVAGVGALHLGGEGVDDSILNGMGPTFDAQGALSFVDAGHNQIKRLPASAF